MDERALFDLFHDALEMEPRAGAYERMRIALTNHPVALKRRPAFRMRWTKMAFRTAAALTAVVIAIALVAAFVASRYAPVGSVPSGQDQNAKAYRAMIKSDYAAMAASTSNHCDTIDDKACEAAAMRGVASLQQWVDHMHSFPTPSKYAVLDGQLRMHLSAVAAELTAAVAFQKVSDGKGFNLAMNAARYERGWIDPATYALTDDYVRLAASYQDAFSLAKRAVNGCTNGMPGPGDIACQRLVQLPSCLGANAELCLSYVQNAATPLQTFLISLMQNPAPANQAAASSRLQAGLAEADTALLAITDAVLKNDGSKVDAALQSFRSGIFAANSVG
jgi:hypothetical protein